MQELGAVYWAVPPSAKRETRPARLIAELETMGLISPNVTHVFHGRAEELPGTVGAGVWNPGRSVRYARGGAVLSPVFGARGVRNAAWVDFYDDWSIAPDINLWHRSIAASAYRAARRPNSAVKTTNSVYMALKTDTPLSNVVPNGVDPKLGEIPHGGDQRRRLLLLGHFFDGRTDFDACEAVMTSGAFQEIVIGGAGSNTRMSRLISSVSKSEPGLVRNHEWIPEGKLAEFVGTRTVALLPNLVNDYTMSQDMMKIYTLQALGVPVALPRALWPSHLDPRFALLFDFGMNVEDVMHQWIESERPDTDWRREFSDSNSWRSRAHKLATIIEGANA